MINQQVTWYSTQSDGNPKTMTASGFVVFARDKITGSKSLFDAYYNTAMGVWFECNEDETLHELYGYDVLYYTSDLSLKRIKTSLEGKV